MSVVRFLVFVSIVSSVVAEIWYKYEVNGMISCHGKPYSGAWIAFYEQDLLDPNDLCAVIETNSSGVLHSSAITNDGLWAEQPDELLMYIVHKCGADDWICTERKLDDSIWWFYGESLNGPGDPPKPRRVDINLEREAQTKCDSDVMKLIGKVYEPETC
ncbi:hypothetical protein M3Y94_00033900 [Aphelenchoides besseyi]|nr:hypothetical protein M3Y94_00033900 [Aphelenchoides besseyi]KAI6218592.1 hypothetical protein M3Y95_01159100 [Aphelenchoides besseyi]